MLWFCLILFSAGFTATVLATPWVISLAHYIGAMDSPDGFRKNHAGSTPRMGGLAVAFGLAVAMFFFGVISPAAFADLFHNLTTGGLATGLAFVVVLTIGLLDDQRDLGPMTKLAGQGIAACLLFVDGFRIERVFLFGINVDFGLLALPATCFWFLGCMNVWNLIDGMDGLASGVGAIVSVTLLLAAGALGHPEVSFAAAALAGALVGFLIYNFHPASIFLGDTGSLLIGMVLGMLAICGSLKSGMTVAILAPILAMGLPIVDTLLAILRRWVRHLPWNVADHGHLHHQLMAFGLTQRQASLFLYSFTVLLCASSLASILQSDSLALLFAILGTLGLAVVFAARREERASIFDDFRRRLKHRRLEQRVARIVWEAIQRLANCPSTDRVVQTAERMAQDLHCDGFRLRYQREGECLLDRSLTQTNEPASLATPTSAGLDERERQRIELRFVLSDWPDEQLTLEFRQAENVQEPLSVGARFLCRFNQELLEKIRELLAGELPRRDLPAVASAASREFAA